MRYDLAFFLCCCKSFLHSSTADTQDYYDLLGVHKDATQDDIKKAYKRQSLQMHPDKLAQRGLEVTEADQLRFTKMKEAYEVLSDPHKRETYDAIGEKGMKWLDQPFSIDPQEMAQNFAHSSWVDRFKIFAIFVAMGVAIFLLPVLICLQADGVFGPDATWVEILTPLWIVDLLMIWYHLRVIYMGPIPRPEGVSLEEWVDPLPMSKRYFSLGRFLLFCALEVLTALKLDGVVSWKWFIIFSPLYVHELTTLMKKMPMARMKIVTVEDLEKALGKPFEEFTIPEKELIAKRYSVVPAIDSAEFETAHKLKGRARQDCIKVFFRAVFMVFLLIQLDMNIQWNWWIVFLPFWTMSFCICLGSYQKFRETQAYVMERDPQMFQGGVTDEEGGEQTNYGAVGAGDDATPDNNNISDEEREEMRAAVVHAGYKMMGSLLSQCFALTIVILFVAKLQGAPFPSLWILSPLLLIASFVLCCLGCTIFCITDVVPEGMEDPSDLEGGIGGERYTAPPPTTTSTTNEGNTKNDTTTTRRSSAKEQEDPSDVVSNSQSYDLD